MPAIAKPQKNDRLASAASLLEELGLLSPAGENRHASQPEPTWSPILEKTFLLPANRLVRHADNRRPTADQVAAMIESITREGQLEPILVRPLPRGVGHQHRAVDGSAIPPSERAYQIVSGETRVLAQFERGVRVKARELAECDDAKALELLAVCNAKRTDLNPIQKARMIERLCVATDAGGAGMTREAAGRVYGLESGQSASNLVKLLELPEEIQWLVETGELPQSFAREAVPYCAVPAIAAALVKEVGRWEGDPPGRGGFVRQLYGFADDHTRPMRAENRKQLSEYQIEHRHSLNRLFEPTAADLLQLEVVTLKTWTRDEERACNLKLWNTLQATAKTKLAAELKAKETRKANRSAGGDAKPAKQKTAAEVKQLEREQDAQLAKRVTAWRHAWLCHLVASRLRELGGQHWVVTKMTLWCLCNSHNLGRMGVDGILAEVLGVPDMCRLHGVDAVCELRDDRPATPAMLLTVLTRALEKPPRNPDYPDWPARLVDQLAGDVGVDLKYAWELLQRNFADGKPADGKPNERLAGFYALHQARQLDELGRELGVVLDQAETKAAKIRILLAQARVLPLPKSIAPLAAGKRKTPRRRVKPR